MTSTNTAACTDLAPVVADAIATARAALVEIDGEATGARYQRIRRVSERLENLRGGYAAWSPEAAAIGVAVGDVFRFRAWGAK